MRSIAIVRRMRGIALPILALIVASCSSSTAPNRHTIVFRRATWTQTRPADYAYDYQVGNGFNIGTADRWIHLVVRGNAVVAATDATTGNAMTEPLSTWPTIEQLFDEAQQAAQNGALTGIRYDAQYGYPTEIDISGPPDAGGSIYAKNLAPAP